MTESTASILKQKANQYGIPYEYVYSVVMTESGGNTSTIGDSGNSFGLFQINKPSHPSFDITRYTDASYQADYMLPTLTAVYKEGVSKGLSGTALAQYIEKNGERPVWTSKVASNIAKHYADITGGKTTTTTDSTGTTDNTSISTANLGLTGTISFWVVAIVIFGVLLFGFGSTIKQILA